MRRARLIGLTALTAALLSCGPSSSSEDGLSEVQLKLSSIETLSMTKGQRVVVLIAVLYTGRHSLTFTAEGLPSFATLEGNRLTFTPWADAEASSHVTLTVTDGERRDTTEFLVQLAPSLHDPNNGIPSVTGCAHCMGCGGKIPGSYVEAYVQDSDGDPVRLEAEIVPEGEALTGVANHHSEFAYPGGEYSLASFVLPLSDLVPGALYRGQARGADITGRTSSWYPLCSTDTFTAIAR